jgi:hypothetical protein
MYTSLPSSSTVSWVKVDLQSPWFSLQTANGVTCVDRCGGPACGISQGNIIAYPCWNVNTNPSQRWKWVGTADADGGQMIASERDTSMCITSCPQVSSRCAFVGDASTAPCNATDPTQRWFYKA